MKKIAFVLVLAMIAAASSLWAEYGKIGIGASGYVLSEKDVDSSNVADTTFTFSADAHLSAMLREGMELRPYIYYYSSTDKLDGTAYDKDWEIGVGAGLYWHVVRTEIFHMGPGVVTQFGYGADIVPATDDSWYIAARARMPIFADFIVGRLVLRTELDALYLRSIINPYNDGAGDAKYSAFELGFGRILRVGLTYRF